MVATVRRPSMAALARLRRGAAAPVATGIVAASTGSIWKRTSPKRTPLQDVKRIISYHNLREVRTSWSRFTHDV